MNESGNQKGSHAHDHQYAFSWSDVPDGVEARRQIAARQSTRACRSVSIAGSLKRSNPSIDSRLAPVYLLGLVTLTRRTPMSYAVFRTSGKQFRVSAGDTIRIPSMEAEAGASIEFNEVLIGSDGASVRVGVPTLTGAKVTGEIVKHGRGDKIVIFKFKRRKNYARKQGHRQGFTEVKITGIQLG
jgi:large subunit ribosomal protein L21